MFMNQKTRGIGLIEVVVGLSVIFVSMVSVMTAYNFFLKVANNNTMVVKAEFLLEEGVEALRFIRDKSWNDFSNIPTDTTYHLVFQEGTWLATSTNLYIDDFFERKFSINNVYRDSGDDISETGVLDDGSRKVIVSVSWFGAGATSTRSTSVYLTNLFDN